MDIEPRLKYDASCENPDPGRTDDRGRTPTLWPGCWSVVKPQISEHAPGVEYAWAVRGHPFTRPVLARTNVGVHKTKSGYEKFVVTQIMADGWHGVTLPPEAPILDGLEWSGPVMLPNVGAEQHAPR